MLSFVCTRIGEQDDLLLPPRATSSFATVAGQGWLAGQKRPLWMRLHVYRWNDRRSSRNRRRRPEAARS
jgi:hypothetical protein